MQNTEQIFCLARKKSKGEEQFYIDDFRKVIIYNSIPDALRDLHAYKCKDLTIDLMMLVYGNRQNAIKFTQANNSDLLRALKYLMETRP